MSELIRSSGDEPPPVWPAARGKVRGQAIEPLHRAAVEATRGRPELSELFSLLDSLRAGDARVRGVAREQLKKRLRALGSRRA